MEHPENPKLMEPFKDIIKEGYAIESRKAQKDLEYKNKVLAKKQAEIDKRKREDLEKRVKLMEAKLSQITVRH